MSALATQRRTRRSRDRVRDAARSAARQERLFGAIATSAAVAPATAPARAREDEPAAIRVEDDARRSAPVVDAPAPEHGDRGSEPLATAAGAISGPTLDEAISALWGELSRGTTISCPACGSAAMVPRHSAGAGVVGGRCGACEATLV
jgi:hypothetical protein